MRPEIRSTLALAVALALAASGCASAPVAERPPVAAPRVTASVRHAVGSPLSGGSSERAPDERPSATTSLQAVVSFVALEKLPEALLEPLSTHARLVAAPGTGRALLPGARFLAGARAGVVPDADRFVSSLEQRRNRFADLRGALPRGVTATFELACDRASGDHGEAQRERVALHVARRSDEGLDVAVEVARAGTGAELALLDLRSLKLGEGLAVIVPSPFEGEETGAVAAVVTVLRAPADDAPGAAAHRLAFARCTADLAREAAFASERRVLPPSSTLPRPDLGAACRALSVPSGRRSALFALAQATGAPLAEDLALSADDRMLAAIAESVARDATAATAPAAGATLGWIIERAAFAGLRNLAGEGEVPPQVEEALVRRGGAAGRSLGTFFGVDEASQSLDDLERRLRAENRDLLEDGSPAIRARASGWLAARGLLPEGYDPLGPADARRAALDKAAAAAEAKRGGP
jgi:hypothetical protein